MEEKTNQLEEDQNRTIKVSDFQTKEIGTESAFEMFYMNKEVYLGYGEDIKVNLIRDKQSGEVSKVIILNKFHSNVFKLSQDMSRLKFEFRSRFTYPNDDIKDNEFFFLQDDGTGVLFWFMRSKSMGRQRISKQFCSLFQVHLQKTKSKQKSKAKVLQKCRDDACFQMLAKKFKRAASCTPFILHILPDLLLCPKR